MDITIQAALMGAVVGALVGGGITYLISNSQIRTAHQNAIELLQQQDFSNACFSFINAFIDELNLLEIGGGDAYVDILCPAFPKHRTAVYIFQKAIHNKDRRAAFDKAWEEYYKNENQPNSPLRQYSTTLQQTDNFPREKRRPLAISRIKALLKFAEKK